MTLFNDTSSVLALLKSRKSGSAKAMGGPGPDTKQLGDILNIAVRVPDHGKLAPWRFVVIEGDARHDLGQVFAARWQQLHPEHGEDSLTFMRQLFLRAPVVLVVLSAPVPHPKVPVWEQELSAGAVCYNILLAATAMGFQPQWQSDWLAYDEVASRAIGAKPGEKIAGIIYLGTSTVPLEDRPRPDVARLVTRWQKS